MAPNIHQHKIMDLKFACLFYLIMKYMSVTVCVCVHVCVCVCVCGSMYVSVFV